MAKVRRTWKALGFKPFGKDILVMDPAMAYHDEAVKKLPQALPARSDPRVRTLGRWRRTAAVFTYTGGN